MTCSQLSASIAVALPTKKNRKPRCCRAAKDTCLAGGSATAAAAPAWATSFVMRTVCQTTGFCRRSALQPRADELRHQLDGVRIAQRRAVVQARDHLDAAVAQLQRHLARMLGGYVFVGAAVRQQHRNVDA